MRLFRSFFFLRLKLRLSGAVNLSYEIYWPSTCVVIIEWKCVIFLPGLSLDNLLKKELLVRQTLNLNSIQIYCAFSTCSQKNHLNIS